MERAQAEQAERQRRLKDSKVQLETAIERYMGLRDYTTDEAVRLQSRVLGLSATIRGLQDAA
jgi:hypothetical protein